MVATLAWKLTLLFVAIDVRIADTQPPLSDLDQFPNREVISATTYAQNQYLYWLEERQASWHWWMDWSDWRLRSKNADVATGWRREQSQACYAASLAELNRSRECWWELYVARNREYTCRERRAALARLRKLLGDAAYYSGTLPPPLPWQHFRVLDP